MKRQERLRRQPLILVTLLNVLVLGIGVTAAVDLRRLQTPGGTALRWAQAAVFGDCDDYRAFSVPDPSVPDPRSPEQLCQDLRAATAQARNENLRIGLTVSSTSPGVVHLVLTRKDVQTPVQLRVRRVAGQWRVVRDSLTCGSLGCA